MGRPITRRDFLHGSAGGLLAGAALLHGCSREASPPPPGPVGAAAGPPVDPALHPPSRLGLRGSHVGSFEVAHDLAWLGKRDFGPASEPDPGVYDLVVVGAGVSGLAAAYFYLERFPDARVLLLENHDDFGGHARRNELRIGDRTIIGYGGSQSLENPSAYSDVATRLLAELGVDLDRFDHYYDQDFFRRNGLASSVYFDRATYGVDRLVRGEILDPGFFLPVARSGASNAEAVGRMPISEPARAELLALLEQSEDRLPDQSILAEPDFLGGISYLDFLTQHLGIREPEVLFLLQEMPSFYYGVGIDGVPALDAMLAGAPGLGGTGIGRFRGLIRRAIGWLFDPYIHHFPDGNASVARLLVRRLLPEVAGGSTMEDVVTARFDYAKLDVASAPVRLRLESTVIGVAHDGDPRSAGRVGVTYVRNGRAERVHARHCVLACYNMIIPHLCPELPEPQREALRSLVKIPLVYTNVLLRDWRAWQQLGIGFAYCPGSWHRVATLDFPVSLGDYRFASDPDQPVVVHMQRVPTKPGLPPREQSRAGRYELYGTSFETIEREIRSQLAGMLGEAGFDPAREIEAIVVNRWPHGYAFSPNPLFDPEYGPGEAPWERGRQPFGRIAIANSDAGARAYLDCAIDEAWRAVGELTA